MSAPAEAGRAASVVGDLLAAIHEVIERHDVTEQEWMAALRFLLDVGRADEFILFSDVTRTSVLIDALSHGGDTGATASDVEGPLYREDPPLREVVPGHWSACHFAEAVSPASPVGDGQ